MIPYRLSTRLREAPRARGAPRQQPRPVAAIGDAVEVPWLIVLRSPLGAIEVEQHAAGPLRSVRFALAGDGMLGLSLPRTVMPGERLRVVVRMPRREPVADAGNALLVLRWFQPDGREFLWPIAL